MSENTTKPSIAESVFQEYKNAAIERLTLAVIQEDKRGATSVANKVFGYIKESVDIINCITDAIDSGTDARVALSKPCSLDTFKANVEIIISEYWAISTLSNATEILKQRLTDLFNSHVRYLNQLLGFAQIMIDEHGIRTGRVSFTFLLGPRLNEEVSRAYYESLYSYLGDLINLLSGDVDRKTIVSSFEARINTFEAESREMETRVSNIRDRLNVLAEVKEHQEMYRQFHRDELETLKHLHKEVPASPIILLALEEMIKLHDHAFTGLCKRLAKH